MPLDEQANKYRALEYWFRSPQGLRVAQAFGEELNQISSQLKGDKLLQLGSCGDDVWLSTLTFRSKYVVSPFIVPQKTVLPASLTMLPVDRNSIDCVIAPLTLEAFPMGKNPMDEIDRVLKPMGYVIFFGVNPFSFWGAALRWGRLSCFGTNAANLMSSLSLKHAMMIRGYRQCSLTTFYYIPPFRRQSLIEKLEFFNVMGRMVWPFPAGFYCFIAQKYQECSPNLRTDAIFNKKIPIPLVSQATGLGFISTIFKIQQNKN